MTISKMYGTAVTSSNISNSQLAYRVLVFHKVQKRHFFSLADGSTFPPPWKDPVPEMVHTSGFSSLRQFPPVQLAAWAAFS